MCGTLPRIPTLARPAPAPHNQTGQKHDLSQAAVLSGALLIKFPLLPAKR
jgi:hypothetical protein